MTYQYLPYQGVYRAHVLGCDWSDGLPPQEAAYYETLSEAERATADETSNAFDEKHDGKLETFEDYMVEFVGIDTDDPRDVVYLVRASGGLLPHNRLDWGVRRLRYWSVFPGADETKEDTEAQLFRRNCRYFDARLRAIKAAVGATRSGVGS